MLKQKKPLTGKLEVLRKKLIALKNSLVFVKSQHLIINHLAEINNYDVVHCNNYFPWWKVEIGK